MAVQLMARFRLRSHNLRLKDVFWKTRVVDTLRKRLHQMVSDLGDLLRIQVQLMSLAKQHD